MFVGGEIVDYPVFRLTRTYPCPYHYFKKHKSNYLLAPELFGPSAIPQTGNGAPRQPLKVVKFILSTSLFRAFSPTSPALCSIYFVLPHRALPFQHAPSSFWGFSLLCFFPLLFCGHVPHQYLCTVQGVQVTIS